MEVASSKPKLAATILLLREGHTPASAAEVLLVRRPENMRAFSDLWVFPGGQIDRADRDATAHVGGNAAHALGPPAHISGNAAHASGTAERVGGNADAVSLQFAACRELFEEVGVLLARSQNDRPADQPQVQRLLRRRSEFVADPVAFYRALSDESLTLTIDDLVPWSRWITPTTAARRFDTAFFAALIPPSSEIHLLEAEVSEAHWLELKSTPDAIIAQGLRLAAPTKINIADLQRSLNAHASCAALLRAERCREIATIQPKVILVNGAPWAVFPWDQDYALLNDESLPQSTPIPAYLQGLPSRLPAISPPVQQRC